MLIDTVDHGDDEDEDENDNSGKGNKELFGAKGKVEVDDDNIEDIMKHLEKYNN